MLWNFVQFDDLIHRPPTRPVRILFVLEAVSAVDALGIAHDATVIALTPEICSQVTGEFRYGALKTSFAAKGSEENLTARRRRRVAGVRGRRIGHRADRACTAAGHTASGHHAR
jgi:hypothetical protein